MTETHAKSKQPVPSRKTLAPPEIKKGVQLEVIIFKPTRRPMIRAALHRALDAIVGAWLTATCTWDDDADFGDRRFVVFSTDVAPETCV